ncbi:LuxR family transcriptional regulator [Planomonospora sp. ID82291]|uniref:helix-turn-helix transcriptional regulator n=1 Tax=Planomonospora sp. ID82291 TaxID=2738136 RepID=UPI0018C4243A|nr:LuxR family transcriptional regulator [Planomonospora sp. ID82291]MBG0816661.1 AAA family ATPase [Planomonospora sp. ID82291]
MSSPSSATPAVPLRGRDAELAALRRLLGAARRGAGGAVLVLGAPGTGKSALLDSACADALGPAPAAGPGPGTTRAAGLVTGPGPGPGTDARVPDPGGSADGDDAARLRPDGDRFVVLRTRGTAVEARLPYAGLHALLRPVADRLGALPPAQAAVLAEALERGTAGGGLALPAAVLNLLLAVGRPVLVCVDDLHHLDAPSRDALFFVARRLGGERIALLLAGDGEGPAVRAGGPADGGGGDGDAPGDVPRLRLGRLDEEAVRQVLDDLAPPGLSEELRASLAEVARGNPLALRELVGALTPDQVGGAAAPPETLPPDGRLWRAYAGRLSRLPGETADLLLLLAADPDLDTATLLRAAEPRCALTALEPAERAGVVVRTAGDRYGFRDPAMGPVVYAGASPARRREAHRLLAGVLDAEHQRLRRAWHRAAALDGPAERLADALVEELAEGPDGTAGGAGGRGGFPEAFRAFERAAELTARGDVRAARLAAAARHAWHAGLPQRARSLLARLNSLAVTEEVRGRAELVRGSLELRSGKTGDACDELLAAADWLLARDREQAVRALIRASEATYLAGDNHRFMAIARRAAALRRPDDPPATQLMFEYLAGVAATFRGRHREAAAPLRRVVELAPSVDNPSVLVWACVSSLMLGEDAQALRLSTRAIGIARAQGAVSTVPQVLEFLIQAELWMGRYASVAANAREGLRLAQETGRLTSAAQHLAWLALTAAVQGDEETCRIRAGSAMELADAHGLGIAGALGTWALAHLDVAAGRHADAAARLRATARSGGAGGHPVVRVMATPHFVEAAVRTGDVEHARAALVVLDRWTGSTRSPDRLALAARCHALLAGPGEAEERFREALDLHERGSCGFETARTQLLFGSVLRRNRRPGAAREHLHGALETFERYGARLWAEQARGELRASGEALPSRRARARSAEARMRAEEAPAARVLTAQQFQIARLVADGATNREVAARLFLSPRTVEHHLRNIFSRLGIRSRIELVRLLS